MPLRKVHEPTFLWFGLPGPLLTFVLCLAGVVTERLSDYHGRAGIISIARWNLCLVIFGVDYSLPILVAQSLEGGLSGTKSQ